MRQLLPLAIGVWLAACKGQGALLTITTVSDYSGMPMAGIRVQVEDQAWRATDADGKAVFDAAREPFTVRMNQTTTEYEYVDPKSYRVAGQASAFWVHTGLTGKEFVAEVYGVHPWAYDATMPGWHTARVSGAVVGRSGPASSTAGVEIPYYQGVMGTSISQQGDAFDAWGTWNGGSGGTLLLTALEWAAGATPGQDHFYGFGSAAVPVTDGAVVTGVSVALQPVGQSLVGGTVSLPALYSIAGASAESWLVLPGNKWLRWRLGTDVVPADGFAVALPSIDGATAWLAIYGNAPPAGNSPPSFGRHARRLDLPPHDQVFRIPAPPDLLDPADGTSLDAATAFRWNAGESGGSSTLQLLCDWGWPTSTTVSKDPIYVSYTIETPGTGLTLPAIPGVALRAGASCHWSVKWCATTDPAAEVRCAVSVERAIVTP